MRILSRVLRTGSGPDVAVELAGRHVSAARVELGPSGIVIAAHAVEELPSHALDVSLTNPNIRDRSAVRAVLGRVLERVGQPRRIGLIVPDLVAKVSLVRFAQVPARSEELKQLIRWQIRKAAPFSMDEAQVSYVPGERTDEGQEFIVVVARRDVVHDYEALCSEAGAHAGIVDLSTFNVVNAVLAGTAPPAGDWLLVNVASEYASMAILRGQHLIFFRNRSSDADETLADLVHQTAMYYEDRLQGKGFGRVVLSGTSAAGRQAADADQIRRSLEARLGARVETADARTAAALSDRIAASPALLNTLTPLVGLLLREREAA